MNGIDLKPNMEKRSKEKVFKLKYTKSLMVILISNIILFLFIYEDNSSEAPIIMNTRIKRDDYSTLKIKIKNHLPDSYTGEATLINIQYGHKINIAYIEKMDFNKKNEIADYEMNSLILLTDIVVEVPENEVNKLIQYQNGWEAIPQNNNFKLNRRSVYEMVY